MPRKQDIQKLIRTPFSAREWETLVKNKEFADAVSRAESVDEAEGLMTLGAQILNKSAKSPTSGAKRSGKESRDG